MRKIFFRVAMAWLAVCGLQFASGCAKTPVTERQALVLVPREQMAALGEEAFGEILAKSQLTTRRDWQEVVQRVGQRITAATGTNETWQISVIDDPQMVNAFALPGGKIAVYTGMLRLAQNEAGLAAVLGHEVAHVVAQHSAERLSQTMIVKLGLTAAQLSLGDSQQRNLILGLLGVGAQVGVMLPFSRMHESEADAIGLTYMAKAGYDPREAVALWRRMAANSSGEPLQVLSTHPSSSNRANELEGRIASVWPLYEVSEKQPSRSIDVSGL